MLNSKERVNIWSLLGFNVSGYPTMVRIFHLSSGSDRNTSRSKTNWRPVAAASGSGHLLDLFLCASRRLDLRMMRGAQLISPRR
ncbi:hypothetical protein TNCV_4861101 [Trichonephila clavipes]|nr:hypothetical protein TNCV_4861101 [Trichonephila clavipes]